MLKGITSLSSIPYGGIRSARGEGFPDTGALDPAFRDPAVKTQPTEGDLFSAHSSPALEIGLFEAISITRQHYPVNTSVLMALAGSSWRSHARRTRGGKGRAGSIVQLCEGACWRHPGTGLAIGLHERVAQKEVITCPLHAHQRPPARVVRREEFPRD